VKPLDRRAAIGISASEFPRHFSLYLAGAIFGGI
jgi:hypothetical protein